MCRCTHTPAHRYIASNKQHKTWRKQLVKKETKHPTTMTKREAEPLIPPQASKGITVGSWGNGFDASERCFTNPKHANMRIRYYCCIAFNCCFPSASCRESSQGPPRWLSAAYDRSPGGLGISRAALCNTGNPLLSHSPGLGLSPRP